MITYSKGAYGLNLLSRVHGSAVYKAVIPGVISVFIYMFYQWIYGGSDDPIENLDHPYVIGVIVTSVSFIIIFRTNNSYQRYWEACGAVHHMMSKFLDATVHMASFHMQCDHFDHIKPPVFYDYPELLKYDLSRDRTRQARVRQSSDPVSMRSSISINQLSSNFENYVRQSSNGVNHTTPQDAVGTTPLLGNTRTDGGWNKLLDHSIDEGDNLLNYERRSESNTFGDTPALFLQELAHLSSLLVAVAFSTLRNDEEGSESPLGVYKPGQDWPAADPHKMSEQEKDGFHSTLGQNISYWLGFDRTPEYRTKYNASRPMLVIGGVSAGEIEMLQKARGASAKTTLAWYWLSEFIGREHVAGSTGQIGAPIISRLFQFLSDGMIFYNHARKIMYIPFPFPHAQLSAIFVLVMTVIVPFMMTVFANEQWLGSILTFLVVTCLSGLHEVGRELENPYKNTPNEIPLCTLLAMYNESLIAMCSGYHPDGYWADDLNRVKRKDFYGKPKPDPTAKAQAQIEAILKIMEQQTKEIHELRKTVEERG